MKPLSGMWLYVNLAFAIAWDAIGFLLFIVGLIPAVQALAATASLAIDVLAFLTDFILCILYQGYVKVYNVNFRVYQLKRIREMIRFSKNSGAAGKNPIAQNLARQTKKINQYMLDKFSNYVINFTVKKIQYSIFTMAIESIPWLGDFSPSWTIKANLHLKEHRRTANELKIRTKEFEESLAKWRGHLRIGGIRKLKSRDSRNGVYMRQSTPNNIKKINRERLAGGRAQSVIEQKDINQGVRDSAANNIRPFRKKFPGELAQSSQIQKENKFAGIKSVVSNAAYASRQLVSSIPQSLESEDEELRYKKSTSNNIKPFKKKVLSDIANPPIQSPKDNNISNNTQPNTISAENDIKKFTRNKQNQENLERILIKK